MGVNGEWELMAKMNSLGDDQPALMKCIEENMDSITKDVASICISVILLTPTNVKTHEVILNKFYDNCTVYEHSLVDDFRMATLKEVLGD